VSQARVSRDWAVEMAGRSSTRFYAVRGFALQNIYAARRCEIFPNPGNHQARPWEEYGKHGALGVTMNDAPNSESAARSAAAERMRAHRARRGKGFRCVTIELHATEVDELVRRGLLPKEARKDQSAIVMALHQHLDRTLN
jgi:hypothetical protein